MRTNIQLSSYLAHFFWEWQMFPAEVVEKIKTHVLCSITFFFESHTVCTITWKNVVRPARAQITIWRLRVACWKPKATNTHSEYIIFIAFAAAKMVSRKRLSVRLIRELLSYYYMALSRRRFANAPLIFVIFFCLYAHNRSITTERIVIKFHDIGGFYKDSCWRISILVKIGRNYSRKLHAVLLASLT